MKAGKISLRPLGHYEGTFQILDRENGTYTLGIDYVPADKISKESLTISISKQDVESIVRLLTNAISTNEETYADSRNRRDVL